MPPSPPRVGKRCKCRLRPNPGRRAVTDRRSPLSPAAAASWPGQIAVKDLFRFTTTEQSRERSERAIVYGKSQTLVLRLTDPKSRFRAAATVFAHGPGVSRVIAPVPVRPRLRLRRLTRHSIGSYDRNDARFHRRDRFSVRPIPATVDSRSNLRKRRLNGCPVLPPAIFRLSALVARGRLRPRVVAGRAGIRTSGRARSLVSAPIPSLARRFPTLGEDAYLRCELSLKFGDPCL
jgi:hypothetical protein